MEMQPNILPTISAGARRRENMRLLALRQRINEEMRLPKEIQELYNKIPYGDERDQLEFDFKHQQDSGDECNCENCR